MRRLFGCCFLAVWLVFLGFSSVGAAQDAKKAPDEVHSVTAPSQVPDPRLQNSWVYDGAGILGDRQGEMDKLIGQLEKDTGAEIGVVTLQSIGELVPKEFVTELFEEWGLGKKSSDNGVLVLHVVDQRRIEIEVGYGLEHSLTDSRTKQIISKHAIPHFKRGDFAGGHYATVVALVKQVRKKGAEGAVGSSSASESLFEPAPGPYRNLSVTLLTMGVSGWLLWMCCVVFFSVRIEPFKAWKWIRRGGFLEYPLLGMSGAGLGFFWDVGLLFSLVFAVVL